MVEVEVVVVVVEVWVVAAWVEGAAGGDRGAVVFATGVVLPLLHLADWQLHAGDKDRCWVLLAALDGCVRGVRRPLRSEKLYVE